MSRWPNKYVIGLTGNIAVGKSVVRQMLQHLGAYTIDADGLTHQAMSPAAPAYKPIVQTFGQFILNPDKTINRQLLGQIVFSNPQALSKLEAITHPIIRGAINTLVSRAKQRVIVIEAIKLLDGELAEACDVVWVVDASPETQLKRLIEKRKMTEADARQRMLAQSAQADKLKRANVVIHNDGNIEDTWKQVQIAWNEVKKAVMEQMKAAQAPAAPKSEPKAQAPAAPQKPAEKPAAPPKPAAKPEPAPAATEAAEEETAAAVDTGDIVVKRGMPSNAEEIAQFISRFTGKEISRMDVMMAFGQKSYLLAKDGSGKNVGLMGFQVENLITRVDEFYMEADAPTVQVVAALVKEIEAASKELQSEVGFIFLPANAPAETVQAFISHGYKVTTVDEIKIPAWREAVQEIINENLQVLQKQLRKDRILKPI